MCKEKVEVYKDFRRLLDRNDNEDIVTQVRDLCTRYGVDMAAICERTCMTWEQLGALAGLGGDDRHDVNWLHRFFSLTGW